MNHKLSLLMLCIIGLLSSCSGSDNFRVMGSIADLGQQNVSLTYFDGIGIQELNMTAVEGKFSFQASTPEPSLAILSYGPYNQTLAILVLENGSKIKIEGLLSDPQNILISGNSPSEEIAQWQHTNSAAILSGNIAEINRAVAEQVSKHPDRLSSTAILASYFNTEGREIQADSLFSLLKPQVRKPSMARGFNNVLSSWLEIQSSAPLPFLTFYSRNDSLVRVNPSKHQATMLAFTNTSQQCIDSVRRHLASLTASNPRPKLLAVEISTAADSAAWRKSLGADTAKWVQSWVRGSVTSPSIRKLAVRSLPYFIVADSIGHIVYRGQSVTSAQNKANQLINAR